MKRRSPIWGTFSGGACPLYEKPSSALPIEGVYMARMMFLAAIGGLVISGCGTAEYDWNQALAANTLAAYQSFIEHHGSSKYAADARGRVLALQDDRAWAQAEAGNTVEAYQKYLQRLGGGVHAPDAQYRITALERAQAWQSLLKDASPDSLQAFLQKYPQGPESNEARQRLAALDYRVQLAVARTRFVAERRRAQIQERFGKLVHGLVVMAPASPRADYRVTSAPMNEADANAACVSLARSHQSCKVVRSEGTPS
jgi:hypothetical protein